MKAFLLSLIICFATAYNAHCQKPGKPVAFVAASVKNMKSILDYYSAHIRFEGDYTVFDDRDRVMNKGEFLKKMITGNYFPLQLSTNNSQLQYRLYKLNGRIDNDVSAMLKQIGVTYYSIYRMEGKKFPDFNYTDLSGKVFNTQNTKGKILVINAWETACGPCVAEMPKLNTLTDVYKNRKDIVFISIAANSKNDLQKFMPAHPFKYAVIPVKRHYVQDQLGVIAYPAHWVIGKDGVVKSMSYDRDEMIASLAKEASKR